jgi:hypothetical protein
VTAPARRGRREEPPPAPGTVEVRVHGSPADVEAFLATLGLGERAWRIRTYPTRSGGVMQYLKVRLPEQEPTDDQ